MSKLPVMTRLSPPTVPMTWAGTPCSAARAASACSAPGRTASTARAADSLNSSVNGSPGRLTWRAGPPDRQLSASA